MRITAAAFSGKDSSKVDHSATHTWRAYLAKNVVSAVWPTAASSTLYAIGVAQPVSVLVDTFGTEKVDREKIQALVSAVDMRPAAIIKRALTCAARGFSKVSCYGPSARTPGYAVGEDRSGRRLEKMAYSLSQKPLFSANKTSLGTTPGSFIDVRYADCQSKRRML